EIAMSAHSCGFDHSPQSLLSPTPAGLVRFQNNAELLCFLRQRLALHRQRVELSFDLTQCRCLRIFGLLQALLVSLQLLFQRLNQYRNGLLSLRQIAFGRLLQPAYCFCDSLDELRLQFAKRVETQSFEAVPQILHYGFLSLLGLTQAALVKLSLLNQQLLG